MAYNTQWKFLVLNLRINLIFTKILEKVKNDLLYDIDNCV